VRSSGVRVGGGTREGLFGRRSQGFTKEERRLNIHSMTAVQLTGTEEFEAKAELLGRT
jgi:hypothetical protein